MTVQGNSLFFTLLYFGLYRCRRHIWKSKEVGVIGQKPKILQKTNSFIAHYATLEQTDGHSRLRAFPCAALYSHSIKDILPAV